MIQFQHLSLRKLLGIGLLVGLTLAMLAKGLPSRYAPATGDRAAAALADRLVKLERLSLPGVVAAVAAAQDRRAPYGYVLTLWALTKISPSFSYELSCLVGTSRRCTPIPDLRLLYWTQLMAAIACLIVSYLILLQICGRHEAAFLGIAIVLVISRFSAAARSLHGDMVVFSLFVLLHWYVALVAIHRKSVLLGALAGLMLGLASLFHVTAVLLAPLVLATLTYNAWREETPARGGIMAAAVCAGLAVAILPGACISYAAYGDAFMTTGTLIAYLSQRVAFNEMTLAQYGASLVYWLPPAGKPIAGLIWPATVIESLEALKPGTLKHIGIHEIEPKARALRAGPVALWWLILTYALGDATRYGLTTIPLILRGIWKAGDVFALVALALLPVSLRIARHRRELVGYAFVLASGACLLLIHAMLAPGYWWLNMPVVILAPLVIAYVMQGF